MDNIRALVNNYLTEVENSLSDILTPTNEIITDLNRFINNNSKRVRSLLCFLYLKANNIPIIDSIIKLTTASELIHNASLLHDDVIDDAEYRRGEKSFYKKFNEKTAILSGDYLLSISVNYLMELKNNDILQLFINTTTGMSNSEIKQYLFRNKSVSTEDYIDIIKGKTASLFAAILESAAILTDSNRDNAKLFGELFGILYQMNNDMQPQSHKNDSLNGIKTAVDILGIEKALILKDNYKQKIREIIQTFPNNKYKTGLEDLADIL